MRRLALLALLLSLPLHAAEEAGRTIFVAGSVTVERDTLYALNKDDPVFELDIVTTAERSRAQLLMRDGAKISLRPGTVFRIEEYFQAGDEREQPDGSVVISADDSAVTELIKGGFRTITGAIGTEDPDDYEVRTPAATMGIRGTHYAAVWCAGDCESPPGLGPIRRVADGLYVGVTEGLVLIVNNAGELLLRAGEYAYVRDRNTRPRRLPVLPPALIDTHDTDSTGSERAAQQLRQTIRRLGVTAGAVGLPPGGPSPAAQPAQFTARSASPLPDANGEDSDAGPASLPPSPDSSAGGFDAEPEQPILSDTGGTLTDGQLPDIRGVALSSGQIPGQSEAFTASSPRGMRSFVANDLSGFAAPLSGSTSDTTYAIGSAAIRDDGFDPVTGFGWGRWTGGTATATLANGTVVSLDLAEQSLHWIYGPQLAARPAMPMSGTANFSLIAGNTDPTDTLGNTGVLGDASLVANFTTATVQSELSLGIAGFDWRASGTGTISSELFNGTYNSVVIGGQTGGTGSFSGFFGAPGSNGLPAGAGLTYGLTDPQGTTVSGAVVFGEPTP